MIQRMLLGVRIWLTGSDHDTGSSTGLAKLTCGTLRYTPATLAILFGWLLWGDFTMTLMESMPSLLVMQLKDHQVSNQAMAVLTVTLFQICNVILNPVISYSSDRYRSQWGRRRPFLLLATPFVTLFLILIPWSPEITTSLMKVGGIRAFLELLPFAPLVFVFGLLIVLFQVFNMFIATVYYYLIPDTVPEAFIGRFYGLFRVFGIFAGMVFSWFVFGHAHAHMRLLFAFFSILYAISFVLMCWKVKEGEYPEVKEEHGHWFSPIKNYAVECFSHPRFWIIFLVYASTQWAGAAGVFALFFYRDEIGLSETEIGRIGTMAMGANLLLSAPFGALVDRWGSQKSLIVGLSVGLILGVMCFFVIQGRLTAWIFAFLMSIPGFLVFLAMGKWTVDMYPRAQYGQFASAAAMIGALGAALLSPFLGKLVDSWNNYYRMCLAFPPICCAIALVASIILIKWPKPAVLETVGVEETT
jgi:maltose/moltooligosaccharide transporter